MNPNALAEWLAFYDQNMPGGRFETDTGSMFVGQGARNQMRAQEAQTSAARRMMFARQMMDQGQAGQGQSPDFFQDKPMPQMQASRGPNYLARMMWER